MDAITIAPRLRGLFMNVFAIVNPLSGARAHPERATRRVALLNERFTADGIDAVVRVTERPRHASALAAEAVRAGARTVIAWGGDGTVNEVAGALVGTATSLGVVPSGSGNGFAAALGIPLDPRDAIDVALRGYELPTDVGEMDGRPFFNIAGIGLDAVIAEKFNAQDAGKRGMGPYFKIGFGEVFRYIGSRYRLCLGDERIEVDALLLAFANGMEYGNGARIAPHARMDDGRLEAVVVEDRSPLRRLWLARHLLTRTPQKAERVRFRSIERATVETDHPIRFHVDGEFGLGGCSVTVGVTPGALIVRVPKGTHDRSGIHRSSEGG